MKTKSTDFDAYIANSAEYARPILKKIRSLFHKACPQIEETIKWGHCSFGYKGIVGGMAAFKEYVTFGFWKEKLLSDPYNLFNGSEKAMMNMSQITDVSQLPADKI